MMRKQIDHIHNIDLHTLTDMYWSDEMQNILENNYEVFKSLSKDKINKVFDIN